MLWVRKHYTNKSRHILTNFTLKRMSNRRINSRLATTTVRHWRKILHVMLISTFCPKCGTFTGVRSSLYNTSWYDELSTAIFCEYIDLLLLLILNLILTETKTIQKFYPILCSRSEIMRLYLGDLFLFI